MAEKPLEGKDKQVFDKLVEKLPGVEFVEFFDRGSTARVYHVLLPIGPEMESRIDRIIKVFKNKAELSQNLDPNIVFQNEITKLISVSHSNVYRYIAQGIWKSQAKKNCHIT